MTSRKREKVGGGKVCIALIAEERGFGKRRKMMWDMGEGRGFGVGLLLVGDIKSLCFWNDQKQRSCCSLCSWGRRKDKLAPGLGLLNKLATVILKRYLELGRGSGFFV